MVHLASHVTLSIITTRTREGNINLDSITLIWHFFLTLQHLNLLVFTNYFNTLMLHTSIHIL